MIIYKDLFYPEEEFISDAYPIKLIDDIVFEVDCQLVTVKQGVDIDIGANPSAEEAEEQLEDGSVQVNNVVHAFNLQEISFDKKAYQSYLKKYVKKLADNIKQKNPDADLKAWQEKITTVSKNVLSNFNDYQFFTGKNFEQEGMIALLNYREDGVTPYFTLFKDGLIEEKV